MEIIKNGIRHRIINDIEPILPNEERYQILTQSPESLRKLINALSFVVNAKLEDTLGKETELSESNEEEFRRVAFISGIIPTPTSMDVNDFVDKFMDMNKSHIPATYRPAIWPQQCWRTLMRFMEIEAKIATRSAGMAFYEVAKQRIDRVIRKTRAEIAIISNMVHRIVADCTINLKDESDKVKMVDAEYREYLAFIKKNHENVIKKLYNQTDDIPDIPAPINIPSATPSIDISSSLARLTRLSELIYNTASVNTIIATAENDISPFCIENVDINSEIQMLSVIETAEVQDSYNIPRSKSTGIIRSDLIGDNLTLDESCTSLLELKNVWDEYLHGPKELYYEGEEEIIIDERYKDGKIVSADYLATQLIDPPSRRNHEFRKTISDKFMTLYDLFPKFNKTHDEYMGKRSYEILKSNGIYNKKPGTLSEMAFIDTNIIDPELESIGHIILNGDMTDITHSTYFRDVNICKKNISTDSPVLIYSNNGIGIPRLLLNKTEDIYKKSCYVLENYHLRSSDIEEVRNSFE